jgi:aryl-alcohol dehydrogenase-like predicted oxidoreductase
MLARDNDIVPIPGPKRVKYLDNNPGAVNVRLTADDLEQIRPILPAGAVSGARYDVQAMPAVDR